VDVDAIVVDGVWWRQVPHGGDPLFRADPPCGAGKSTSSASPTSRTATVSPPSPSPRRTRPSASGPRSNTSASNRRDGFSGVLAPSAARPEHLVLCLFREADEVDGAVPLGPPRTYRRPPAPPTGMTT